MRRFIARFLNDEDGATAIEYGLICALIVLVIISGLAAIGGSNEGSYGRTMQKISDALKG
ncbi:fimbrial protein [Brevundimonas intermedia]|jgi:pilus assembly protein Flp/PilA|uniref:Fimbrial protein n=1 Tax=Brevundimonas intermedia TaxID=74315 RepID=A0ABQ5TAM2_9CAUL|nr:Flp family type IVb pilin [Brevundimonas intermedia]GLK49428.1 fimbrial protein [Brevundimonas intermedia]